LEITKTTLSLMLVVITILTALTTTVAAVYAGGDDDDNRDGNKQKAEDNSAAAIADCDGNDVERAGFDCIAIAATDVEIETQEESATLRVCKEVIPGSGFEPEDFDFTVTGNGPIPAQFEGDADCIDVDIGPGEYTVTEAADFGFQTGISGESDCVQDPSNRRRATGEIQAGETQTCTFINSSAG
jgi:hypothetical protein